MMGATEELPADALDELAQVPFDDVFEALNQIKRRKVLFALLDHNSMGESPDIADTEGDDFEHHLVMYHVHLPKLAEFGYINWNQSTHEITRGPNFDEIQPLLELLLDYEDELPSGWM